MIYLTSNKNNIIKETKQLKEKKHREQNNLFFVEGIKSVEEALKEGADIQSIFISDKLVKNNILEKIKATHSITLYNVTDSMFNEISDTKTPQGILAVIKMNNFNIGDILKENNFILILDSIADPGNLGTIIRTADAAGVNGIVLLNNCVDVYNPKVLRSTMGSIFRVPIINAGNDIKVLEVLKNLKIKIFASHIKAINNYFDVDFKKNVAIIIGNEAFGISQEVLNFSDTLIKIPMIGQTESLNASVACGIMSFEVMRQRML